MCDRSWLTFTVGQPSYPIQPERSVILSAGVVREANDVAVEGPRYGQFNRQASWNSHSQS